MPNKLVVEHKKYFFNGEKKFNQRTVLVVRDEYYAWRRVRVHSTQRASADVAAAAARREFLDLRRYWGKRRRVSVRRGRRRRVDVSSRRSREGQRTQRLRSIPAAAL